MPTYHVRMLRSWAGTPQRQRDTLEGLGLYRIDQLRVLPATEATLGMLKKVAHLVEFKKVDETYQPSGRRHTHPTQSGSKAAAKKAEKAAI